MCFDTEVNVNGKCIALDLGVLPSLHLDGPGFLVTNFNSSQATERGHYLSVATVTAFIGGAHGLHRASVSFGGADFSITSNYTPPHRPAVAVAGVLASPEDVWAPGEYCHVVFQLYDDVGTSPAASPSVVAIRATEMSDGRSFETLIECSGTTPTCNGTVVLPASWHPVPGQVPTAVALQYGLDKSGQFEPFSRQLRLHGVPRPPRIKRAVVLQLPHHQVRSGERLRCPIYFHVGLPIVAFTIKLNTSAGLAVAGITATDSWIVRIATNGEATSDTNEQSVLIQGLLVASASLRSRGVGPDVLVNVELVVRAIDSSQLLHVDGSVVEIMDIDESLLSKTDVPFMTVGSTSGGVASPTPAEVAVYSRRLVGLFAVTESGSSFLLNTAVINERKVSLGLEAIAVYDDGSAESVKSESGRIQCKSSGNSTAAEVTSCLVVLAGTESNGGEVRVLMTLDGELTTMLTLTVWFPQLPLEVMASDAVLNRIVDTDGCASGPRYQQAKITARTSFSAVGTTRSPIVDVTPLITDRIQSNRQADLAVVGTTIIGLNPGALRATVIGHGGSEIGSVGVSISDDVVAVTRVEVLPIVGVDIEFVPEPTDPLGTLMVTVKVARALDYPARSAAQIFAEAVFDDGMRQEVRADDGQLVLVSHTKELVVTESGAAVELHGFPDAPAVLEARWLGACGDITLHSSKTKIDCVVGGIVDPASLIFDPSSTARLKIVGLPSMLTLQGDPAGAIGTGAIPAEAQARVILQHDDIMVDVTADPRLVLIEESADGPGLLALGIANDELGNVSLNVATTGASGSGVIRAQFGDLTTHISMEVVTASGLELRVVAVPTWPGAEAHVQKSLAKFSGSNVYQQALILAQLTLSNGGRLRIVDSTTIRFKFYKGAEILSRDSIVTDVLVIEEFLLSVIGAPVRQEIKIMGWFRSKGAFIAADPVTVEVIDVDVFATAVSIAIPSSSLRNGEFMTSATASVAVDISDGTR